LTPGRICTAQYGHSEPFDVEPHGHTQHVRHGNAGDQSAATSPSPQHGPVWPLRITHGPSASAVSPHNAASAEPSQNLQGAPSGTT